MADAPSPSPRRAPALVATAAVLLVLLAAATATAVDRPTQPVKLTLISTANGAALADAHGNPLYLREADKPNTPGCTGRCAAEFPAAVGSAARGHGVTAEIGHTPHPAHGSDLPQVLYARHPLYYYAKDRPKRPRGQDVDGFRLVAPDGSPLPTGEIGTATSRPESPAPHRATPSHRTTHPATHRPATPSHRTSASASASAGTGADTGTSAQARTDVTPSATRRATRAPVGALQATPSGAASGGAVHPVTATAADRARATDAARISLAVGAVAAVSAVAVLAARGRRRNTTGGEH
ncbi:hypothetical protein [Streptomyces sp. DW26H14]|uniref:hypothetical protein n=1 Tax=Streptomyces sp. DW26H14 TaxID=3435395 RepID=UPI00403D9BF9